MAQTDYNWPEIARNGLKLSGNGYKGLEMAKVAENGQIWLDMVGIAWKWLELADITGHGLTYPNIAGYCFQKMKWLEKA